jgi:predicted molibdopterin-dependent oxidoreductase YjgC
VGRGARPRRRRLPAHDRRARRRGDGLFSCSKATNEVNFMAQKLARVALGTNNVDSCNRT